MAGRRSDLHADTKRSSRGRFTKESHNGAVRSPLHNVVRDLAFAGSRPGASWLEYSLPRLARPSGQRTRVSHSQLDGSDRLATGDGRDLGGGPTDRGEAPRLRYLLEDGGRTVRLLPGAQRGLAGASR